MDKFELIVEMVKFAGKLQDCLQHPGVISLSGITGAWKSAFALKTYYEQMLIAKDNMPPKRNIHGHTSVDLGFTVYSWVNVPHPFNLMDLCLRLFLDFHSDDLEAKQTAAFSIMEGRQDPIEGCFKLLHHHQKKCFVVIDGVRSKDDWDLIRDALLYQRPNGCVLVITDEESVARWCVRKENRVIIIDSSFYSYPLIKVCLL
jgi:hypothetical protein